MKAETLFLDAIAIEGEESRVEFVENAPASQEAKDEALRLLQAHQNPDEFLDAPVGGDATVSMASIAEAPGTMIGHYKLLQKIGEGGFGVVYMAERTEEIQQKVAIKIVKPGMDTKEVIARFEAERQALALMNHPNIARVIDAGTTETGRPYFVMDLVKGVPITEFCDANKMTGDERLRIFTDVCAAVQHAHQKGIIHRDIKPSNVLVTLVDSKPVPKIIDFGVAKALNQRLTQRTLFTSYGHMIGTPQYMSPEQAELSALDVDTRSDVYSLGVLLYELLTGTTPVKKEEFVSAAFDQLRKLIREKEAERPSHRLSTLGQRATIIANKRSTAPKVLSQYLHGDLDWIVLKAIEKERARRYESPTCFADDIERFLKTLPIEARRPSVMYRTGKFLRRNAKQIGTAVAFASLLALCVGLYTFRPQGDYDAAMAVPIVSLMQEKYDAGDFQAAEENGMAAERILVQQLPDSAEQFLTVSRELAWTRIQQGRYSEAFRLFEDAMQSVIASGCKQNIVQQISQDRDYLALNAAMYICIREDSAADFEEARRLTNSSRAPSEERDVVDAFALVQLGREEAALDLLAKDPHNYSHLFPMVASLALQGNGDQEEANFARILAHEYLRHSTKAFTKGDRALLFYFRMLTDGLKFCDSRTESTGMNFLDDLSPDEVSLKSHRLSQLFPKYETPYVLLAKEAGEKGDLRIALDHYLHVHELDAGYGSLSNATVVASRLGDEEEYKRLSDLLSSRISHTANRWNNARDVIAICLSQRPPDPEYLLPIAEQSLAENGFPHPNLMLAIGMAALRCGELERSHEVLNQGTAGPNRFAAARKAYSAIAASELGFTDEAARDLEVAEEMLKEKSTLTPGRSSWFDHHFIESLVAEIAIQEAKEIGIPNLGN